MTAPTLAAVLASGIDLESQLNLARSNRERLLKEAERLDEEVFGTYREAGATVERGDPAIDQAARGVARARIREAAIAQELTEVESLIALLEDEATVAAFSTRDAERRARTDAQAAGFDSCEEHLRRAADGLRAAGIGEPELRGAVQRFFQYVGEAPPGLGAVSPGVLARPTQSLSEIFLHVKSKARAA